MAFVVARAYPTSATTSTVARISFVRVRSPRAFTSGLRWVCRFDGSGTDSDPQTQSVTSRRGHQPATTRPTTAYARPRARAVLYGMAAEPAGDGGERRAREPIGRIRRDQPEQALDDEHVPQAHTDGDGGALWSAPR